MARRVVVTGMGLVTALGNDLATSWKELLAGRSGVARITRFDPEGFATRIAAEVKDFDPERWIEKKQFPFPLLADTDKKVIEEYGVRGFGPIAVKRSTFVIDAEGIVRHKRVASIGVTWDKPGALAKIVAGV